LKKFLKSIAVMSLSLLLFNICIQPMSAKAADDELSEAAVAAPSAILVERTSGTVLYEKNAHEKLKPASVTKIMSMLLIMEAIEDGSLTVEDKVTASEHASSMGGSQIYLEPGEQMTVHDMLKSIAVSSANDACVAMAEHVAGSEESFVARMNERAAELGMKDTTFKNCTGLDADGHVTSAYDISLMSRELLSHDQIKQYTTIWMDTIRDGAFGLSNTNKLVKFYNGSTGLKTGFTSEAGYCVSASAMRDGMELIAVIMKAETSPKRNSDASALLNYGFANYTVLTPGEDDAFEPIPVKLGKIKTANGELEGCEGVLVRKAQVSKLEKNVQIAEELKAPVEKGQKIGTYTVTLEGKTIAEIPIVASEQIEKLSTGDIYKTLLGSMFMRSNEGIEQ